MDNLQKRRDTKSKITKAFMDAYASSTYSSITVSDICQRAGINRGTFYNYFNNLDELLSETVDTFFAKMYENTSSLRSFSIDEIRTDSEAVNRYYLAIATILYTNKELVLSFMSPYADPLFLTKYKNNIYSESVLLLKKAGIEVTPRISLLLRQMCGGVAELHYRWLKDGKISKEVEVEIVSSFVRYTYDQIFEYSHPLLISQTEGGAAAPQPL